MTPARLAVDALYERRSALFLAAVFHEDGEADVVDTTGGTSGPAFFAKVYASGVCSDYTKQPDGSWYKETFDPNGQASGLGRVVELPHVVGDEGVKGVSLGSDPDLNREATSLPD